MDDEDITSHPSVFSDEENYVPSENSPFKRRRIEHSIRNGTLLPKDVGKLDSGYIDYVIKHDRADLFDAMLDEGFNIGIDSIRKALRREKFAEILGRKLSDDSLTYLKGN